MKLVKLIIIKLLYLFFIVGEKHGTITARINDKINFEVTTLRIDKVYLFYRRILYLAKGGKEKISQVFKR